MSLDDLRSYYQKVYPEYSQKQIEQLIHYHITTGHSA